MAVIVYAPQGSGMSERALEQLRMHHNLGSTAQAFNWEQLFDPRKWPLVKGMNVLLYVRDQLPPEFQHIANANPRRVLSFQDATAQAGLQVLATAEA